MKEIKLKIPDGIIGQTIKNIDCVDRGQYVQYNIYLANGRCICIEMTNNNYANFLFEE